MNLPLLTVDLILEAQDTLFLPPYKGSTVRGGLGRALKLLFCNSPRQECVSCPQIFSCGYVFLFETQNPGFHGGGDQRHWNSLHIPSLRNPRRGMPQPGHPRPRPFVLLPPLTQETEFPPGSRLTLGLTLIGRAIDYFPHFLLAVEHMGRIGLGQGWGRGRGRLRLLEARTPLNGSPLLYNGTTRLIEELLPVHFWSPEADSKAHPRDLTIFFQTPARLVNRKKVVRELPFMVLIRNLLRRLHHLAAFAPQPPVVDYSGLALAAEKVATGVQELSWHEWQRYSHRQERPVDMDGIVGRIQYLHVPPIFHPLLKLGQWVHVGKGTSLGLGKYVILEEV